MAWVEGRYAARSIRRNVRRSILAIAGIAIGCMLALVMEGFNRGRDEMFARAGTYSGAGHLRIVAAGWRGSRELTLRLAGHDQDLAAATANPAVIAVTPRTRSQALLAMGTRVTGVELVGVDPVREPPTNRLVRTVHEGRYLRANESGTLVVGGAIARRLGARLDDDILASVVGPKGDIENAMFRIVGIVRTGGDAADQMICQVPIGDMPALTGRPGIGEVAVTLSDWRRSDEVRSALAAAVASGDDVMTWEELNPDFKGHLKQDQQTSALIRWIILFIVFLGVTSSQLAAVLERRREFAVLSALGMSGWTMVRLVLLEAATLGFLGGVLGTAVGGPLIWWLSTTGIDLTRFMGSDYTFGSALIEPRLFVGFGWWVVPYMLSVALGATMVASLYPATFAARTDPAVALRVAQ
jgi:ABC-type lipoprotein release transport system permease subunit